MTHYNTIISPDIIAPKGAMKADIRITANLTDPWTSGTALFDDFSVTISSSDVVLIKLASGVLLAIPAAFAWIVTRRRKVKFSGGTASNHAAP
jgi:hypothetical protein